jgi:hypothetical protein
VVGVILIIFRGVALFADDGTTRDDTTQQEEAIGLFVDKIWERRDSARSLVEGGGEKGERTLYS